jgi:invasion protein IalB
MSGPTSASILGERGRIVRGDAQQLGQRQSRGGEGGMRVKLEVAIRIRFFASVITGLAVAGLLGAVAASTPGFAQTPDGTVKAQHGDWQVVCKPPPPGAKSETCALVQSVTAEDRNNVGLTVYFQKFSNGTQVLRVFAPVGVLLPPGLGLKIDDKDVGHAPFLRCHAFACYAQVVAEEKLIELLKTGKTAIFIIFQTEEAGIGIPISLAGFTQALAALQ